MLHYHNAYGHNIYQGGDIPQGAPTHKFTWPLDEVVLWSHVTICKYMQQQLTHWHQTRKGADLQWEAPIFQVTLPFDYVTNVRSRDNLKF